MTDHAPSMDRPDRVVLIAGPTASGKSALAVRLARHLGGTIINADSMQVYRDLRIVTARPSPQDEAEAPHRLYGALDGAERCSAGRFVDLARNALRSCAQDGRTAILVGGTGLYFRALTEGLSPIPPVPDAIAADAARRVEEEGPDALHTALGHRDPGTAAMLRPTDRQRLARAWALLEATGSGLAHWQRQPGTPLLAAPTLRILLEAPRPWLWGRADGRFQAMLEQGGRKEVAALLDRDLDPSLPVMKAVGVREIAGLLEGSWDQAEAVRLGQTATRQYIKRQTTWFRHQMADWLRLPAHLPEAAFEEALDRLGAPEPERHLV
ncbi:MAG: tRNA (adenosine(37)-N6)-dimethylallyltransferase MiaA [Alphaproteobacteria bacterium]